METRGISHADIIAKWVSWLAEQYGVAASDVIVLASRHQNNQAIINMERIHGSELQAPQLLPMNPCAAAAPLQVKLTSLNRHELSCPVLAHPAVLSSA